MSGKICAYDKCNHTKRKNPELAFFRFPRSTNAQTTSRIKIWVKNAGLPDDLTLEYYRSQLVCQLHFEKWCFANALCKRLVHNAIPTITSDEIKQGLAKCTSQQTAMGDLNMRTSLKGLPILENDISILKSCDAVTDIKCDQFINKQINMSRNVAEVMSESTKLHSDANKFNILTCNWKTYSRRKNYLGPNNIHPKANIVSQNKNTVNILSKQDSDVNLKVFTEILNETASDNHANRIALKCYSKKKEDGLKIGNNKDQNAEFKKSIENTLKDPDQQFKDLSLMEHSIVDMKIQPKIYYINQSVSNKNITQSKISKSTINEISTSGENYSADYINDNIENNSNSANSDISNQEHLQQNILRQENDIENLRSQLKLYKRRSIKKSSIIKKMRKKLAESTLHTNIFELIDNCKIPEVCKTLAKMQLMTESNVWEATEKDLALSLYTKFPVTLKYMRDKLGLRFPTEDELNLWIENINTNKYK